MYALSSYHYDLPEELIAQDAVHPHHDARLMVIDKNTGALKAEDIFWNLDTHIPEDRVIFFNNSRVLPARIRLKQQEIEGVNGQKKIIQEGEILFCQKQIDGSFEALVRPGKKFPVGTKIFFGKGYLEVTEISQTGRYFRASGITLEEIMEHYGELPLPPYIAYEKSKESDYQTVFAETSGSVAAPTASLHFTEALLEKLHHEKVYLTLHVGLGTFQGVDTTDIRDYHIHSEMAEIDMSLFSRIAKMKQENKKILAVGTTVCRTLESLPFLWKTISIEMRDGYDSITQDYWDGLNGEQKYIGEYAHRGEKIFFDTSIYIYPGYTFQIIDELITNFHLPESSLLMLVSAFLGKDETFALYEKAIEKKYRFFSFGDGMYIRSSGGK